MSEESVGTKLRQWYAWASKKQVNPPKMAQEYSSLISFAPMVVMFRVTNAHDPRIGMLFGWIFLGTLAIHLLVARDPIVTSAGVLVALPAVLGLRTYVAPEHFVFWGLFPPLALGVVGCYWQRKISVRASMLATAALAWLL